MKQRSRLRILCRTAVYALTPHVLNIMPSLVFYYFPSFNYYCHSFIHYLRTFYILSLLVLCIIPVIFKHYHLF